MERYKTYNEGSFIIDDFNGRKVLRACLECDRDVVVPDDIKAIKSEAFKDHSEIRSIKIPEGVFHIGADAFAGCKHLKKIKISDLHGCYDKYAAILEDGLYEWIGDAAPARDQQPAEGLAELTEDNAETPKD